MSERGSTRPGVILFTMSLCTMTYVITLTIVNVALPQMQGALSATPDQISWVVTLNLVATAVTTPMTGWLVARWGGRAVILWSLLGFTIATAMCATANTLTPLLIYRVAQGAFGAPMVPMALAVIVATYPIEKRAMAQSIYGMSVVIGPGLAPAIGGYMAEEFNWRWIFLLILPICVMSIICVFAFIRDSGKVGKVKLDWTGFIALSVTVTCLQLILDRGERFNWFESTEITLIAATMVLAGYFFIAHTATHASPFINPAIFRDRNFAIGLFLVFVYGMLNVTPTVLFPPLLQNLKGFPDGVIGWILAMRGLGMVPGFFVAARMSRLDPRVGLAAGLLCIGLSGLNTATFDLNVSAWEVAWTGILQGFGCGLMWVPLTVVTFATLENKLLPEASSIFHLLRNYGSSIFISLSVMVVIRTGKVSYSELTETVNPFNERLSIPAIRGLWDTETVGGLRALSGEIARQADMIGYINSFILYTVVCFATVPLLILVRIKRA